MYRIDLPTASPTLPVPAALGSPGYFTDGDVVAGVPATILPADFMNMIMMELYNVVIAAGIAPSKSTYTQLRDAIGMAGSAAPSGWVKLPFGLILQWGTVAIPVNGTSTSGVTATFPVGFTSAVYYAGGTADNSASSSWGWLGATCQAVGLGNMSVVADTANPSNPIAAGRNVRWIAIGK